MKFSQAIAAGLLCEASLGSLQNHIGACDCLARRITKHAIHAGLGIDDGREIRSQKQKIERSSEHDSYPAASHPETECSSVIERDPLGK
jgi:hypothetical protein